MLDASTPLQQRSKGAARVALGGDGSVRDLFQQGSAKAIMPRVHSEVTEVVFLNTSGGLTGGDRLSYGLEVASGTTVMAATQTAERAYASSGGIAEVEVKIRVGDGGFCLWMPQETILFERSSLRRILQVSMQKDARFLGVETLVLGRAAMGETPQHLSIEDIRQVWGDDGQPLHAEHLRITGDTLSRRSNGAGLADKTVFASLVYIATDAEDRLAEVRKLVMGPAQVTAFGQRLILRAEANDSWDIRRIFIPIIKALGVNDVPRVWQT
ncbi:MAG: urease accessory protein UreD [Boseongicola sp.]|nr:urease accessory protein UreD [Boseongicola sp.]